MNRHLAQINIARAKGPLDGEVMREFMEALDSMNALAEQSPGFVWRFKTESGNATSVVAYPDPRVIVNLTVWTGVDALKDYVYRSMHGRFFARRSQWFEPMEGPHLALWWVAEGSTPTVEDGRRRLQALADRGETPFAFSFRKPFDPE